MIFYLIYVSHAVDLMTDEQLTAILNASRRNNHKENITGMLIYVEGIFMNARQRFASKEHSGRYIQLLEGTEESVRAVFSDIILDDRHNNIILLQEDFIEERCCGDWEMGFSRLNQDELENISGFSGIDKLFDDQNTLKSSKLPLRFLSSFYQMSKAKI